MCGITGILANGPATRLDDCVRVMADTLARRGPDGSGIWTGEGVALAHRRLAILDLSEAGAQPMISHCGRYVITYNGEVYNHLEMRRELEAEGHTFSGTSDTETLLAAIAQWGLEDTLKRCFGMFAFALWDKQERTLRLIRDRLGIKPLYYGWAGKDFIFGSQPKALAAHPTFDTALDRDSLTLYFRYNYIPSPHCIYQNAHKLAPGTILTLKPGGEPTLSTYWSTLDVWSEGAASPLALNEDAVTDELETLLRNAVSIRLLSDVPLGVFLSGGIDSSLVAALAQQSATGPVRTFSIGFHEDAYDESRYAKRVAAHLGTDHTELHVTPRDLLDTVPHMPGAYDEPFGDSSQIPTYCLSRLTRKHVTVALSGDGGDELFSGYARYMVIARTWNAVRRLPHPLRKGLAGLGKALPPPAWNLLGAMGPKIRWRLAGLSCPDLDSLYEFLLSNHALPPGFVLGGELPPTPFTQPDIATARRELDSFRAMSLTDLLTYLPDDILTKMDRASMAASLEARIPLLDHRMVEFAARVPSAMNISGMEGKQLLRRVLYKHVPRALVDRPKAGFTVPVDRWMKRELKDWCESLLDQKALREQGFINADHVQRMWRGYLAGERNWFTPLWSVLMFQAWLTEVRP